MVQPTEAAGGGAGALTALRAVRRLLRAEERDFNFFMKLRATV